MWATKMSFDSDWEPNELVILKQKLAKLTNNSCKCLKDRPKYDLTPIKISVRDIKHHGQANDKNVQIGTPIVSYDQITQIDQGTLRKFRKDFIDSVTKDVLCPSCYVTMSLLRGGGLKIIKDEESETINQMFSCDKSTENRARAIETHTSNLINSNLSIYDLLSDSDESYHRESKKSEAKLQVKFTEDSINEKRTGPKQVNEPCVCLEKFMDSIRPPIINY